MTSFLVVPAVLLLLSVATKVGVVTAELFYSTTRQRRRTASATAFVVPSTASQRNRIPHVFGSSETNNNVNEAVVTPATDTATTKNVFERHFQQVDNTFLTQGSSTSTSSVVLTYLEHNGWIMSFKEINLLIDPILEGSLNFNLPVGIYEAKRQTVLPLEGMIQPGTIPSLERMDALVITQGLDDHAHFKTLDKLSQINKFQTIPIIAPPSAQNVLKEAGFSKLQVLNHGDVFSSFPNNKSSINIRATTGALVGPPWQTRENGYVFEEVQGLSIYLEPHVEFNQQELLKLRKPVDIVISPIVGQQIDPLGGYKIVQGPTSTIDLLDVLKPKYLVPMNNGDLQSQGILSDIVSQVGTKQDVPNALSNKSSTTQFVNVLPGQPIVLSKS